MAPAGPARRSGVNDCGVAAEMHSFRAQRADPRHRVAPGQDVTGLPGGEPCRSAPGFLPASAAAARMISIWAARSAAVSPAAGEIPVAAPSGAACRGPARSPDVNRERAGVEGLGEAAQVLEGEELPAKADPIRAARPQQAQHVDRLIGTAATRGEVNTHRFGLTRQDAEANGQQPHPPLGQHVDGGQPLSEHDRVVVGQQQDVEGGVGRSSSARGRGRSWPSRSPSHVQGPLAGVHGQPLL